jgi:hypothetical protein
MSIERYMVECDADGHLSLGPFDDIEEARGSPALDCDDSPDSFGKGFHSSFGSFE